MELLIWARSQAQHEVCGQAGSHLPMCDGQPCHLRDLVLNPSQHTFLILISGHECALAGPHVPVSTMHLISFSLSERVPAAVGRARHTAAHHQQPERQKIHY